MTDAEITKLGHETGLAVHSVKQARHEWNASPMHKILTALINREIESCHITAETCFPSEIQAIQGQITAYKKTIAILNTQRD